MTNRISWDEFRASGMMWWINMILHTFGLVIQFDLDESGSIIDVYPCRCKFRGFSEPLNTAGYARVTKYLSENVEDLVEEVKGE